MNDNDARKLISAEELSAVLGVPVTSIYRWTRQGDLPHYSPGGRQYRYSVDEVLAAIRQPAQDTASSGRRGKW